jgi:hypothetical protein
MDLKHLPAALDVLAPYPVYQNANFPHFQFNHVGLFEKPAAFESAAIANRPGAHRLHGMMRTL